MEFLMLLDEMRTRVYARASEFRALDPDPAPDISPERADIILRYAFVDVLFDVLIDTNDYDSHWRVAELERARRFFFANIAQREQTYAGGSWDWAHFLMWELAAQREEHRVIAGLMFEDVDGTPDPRWWMKLVDELDKAPS
jgi:hypothetical protein